VAILPIGDYMFSALPNYEYIVVRKDVENAIQTISDYMAEKEQEGYRVRVANDSAAAYRIPLNTYEKNWDMLLVGNVGTNSVSDLLESSEKCLYLVYKHNEVLGAQNHFEVIEYIENNYAKVGEILSFDIYEKN
jgi:hypothetical protein